MLTVSTVMDRLHVCVTMDILEMERFVMVGRISMHFNSLRFPGISAICIGFKLDVNECDIETDNCHSDAFCINANGSFTCTCYNGYSGDGILCEGRSDRQEVNLS